MTAPNGTATNGVNGSSVDVAALRSSYENAGQGHVFAFWDKLSPEEQNSFAAQLATIDVDRVNRIYRNAVAAEAPVTPQLDAEPSDMLAAPEQHLVGLDRSRSPSPRPEPVTPLPESACASLDDKEEEKRWRDIGLKAIANNEVAVFLLAGGQGTRLGSSSPKGMYSIDLPSGRTLFQYQAARIKKLEELAAAANGKNVADVHIRWYVMTSGPTRRETEAYFKKSNYFGLDPEDVIFFEQGVLPALSNDGKLLLASPSSVSVAPDGNGGIYAALRRPLAPGSSTSVLSDLHDRGIKYVHGFGVDNCLVRIADPVFVGCCIERKAACGAKVVRKTVATESVGVFAQRGDGYAVIEYSELSREKAEMTDARGRLAFWAANIVNHFYTIDFLDSIEAMERKMAFHIARKKIPCVDTATGEQLKPTEPNGMKLELFIFDVFPFSRDFCVLEVDRAEEFSGLKNAPGSKVDSPETSKRDLLAQQRRWLEAAGATVAEGALVEVLPEVSYAGEGLEWAKGKTFTETAVLSSAQ